MNGFWLFMLFMNIFVPLVMIGFGKLITIKPPKNINGIYGYRTTRSMKNQETWDFAHRHLGKLWFIIGMIIVVLTTPILQKGLSVLCTYLCSLYHKKHLFS